MAPTWTRGTRYYYVHKLVTVVGPDSAWWAIWRLAKRALVAALGSSPVALQKLWTGRDWSMVMDHNTGLGELLLADARHTTPSRIKAFRTLASLARYPGRGRDGCQMSQSQRTGTGRVHQVGRGLELGSTPQSLDCPWPLVQLEVVPLEEKRKRKPGCMMCSGQPVLETRSRPVPFSAIPSVPNLPVVPSRLVAVDARGAPWWWTFMHILSVSQNASWQTNYRLPPGNLH
jgi:hypothetical protein